MGRGDKPGAQGGWCGSPDSQAPSLTSGHKDIESSMQVTSYYSCFWKAQATSQSVGVSACLALSLWSGGLRRMHAMR